MLRKMAAASKAQVKVFSYHFVRTRRESGEVKQTRLPGFNSFKNN
jgi:hypothetical protein